MRKISFFAVVLLMGLASCAKGDEPIPEDLTIVADMKAYLGMSKEEAIQSLIDKQFVVVTGEATFSASNQTTSIDMDLNTSTNKVFGVRYSRSRSIKDQAQAMRVARRLSDDLANYYASSSYNHAEITLKGSTSSKSDIYFHLEFIAIFEANKDNIVDCREYYDHEFLSQRYWYVIFNSKTENSFSFKLVQ